MYSKKTSKTLSQFAKFSVKKTFKKASKKIGLLWIFALLVSSLPMVYEPLTGQTPVAEAATCSVPSNPSILGGVVKLSNINVNSTGTNCVTVNPGSTIKVSLKYFIYESNKNCPYCIDQIQVGFSDQAKPSQCIYNGIPGFNGVNGSATTSFTAPSSPGTYYLAFDRSQDYGCLKTSQNWWSKPAPGSDSGYYFAQVIVPAPAPTNNNWVNATALSFTADTAGRYRANLDQTITEADGSRWFKFNADASSRVFITLSGVSPNFSLPINMDLTLHKNIQKEYDALNAASNSLIITAQAAPSEYLPSEYLPSEYLPSEYLPSEYLPSEYLPSEYLPSEYLPSEYLNTLTAPETTRPTSYLAEPYSGALKNSLLAVSARLGTSPEYISRNTRNTPGTYYIRVKNVNGAGSSTPFHLEVITEGGSCMGVSQQAGNPSYTPVTGYDTVIVTDFTRLDGTAADKSTLRTKLDTFSRRDEVKGVVIDLGATTPSYPRISTARQVASSNIACPLAQNLLASEIKALLDSYSPKYIVIVGTDNVIPFFRYPDLAGLGNESDYIPPVNGLGASAAALFGNMVLGQDYYGSKIQYNRSDLTLSLPDASVGRLVESASDAITMLDAYTKTNGVITPTSALVTGYSFVTSLGNAVKDEFASSINPANCGANCKGVDSLISETWTADDLRRNFINQKHDMVFLAAHFSAGSAEAADRSRILSSELANSPVDQTNSLVFSVGCHSGYNIPLQDEINGYSPDPDWSKTFAGKGITSITGTGYQYGDTNLIEYSARLYNELTIQLHTRSSAGTPVNTSVPIGQALVKAKKQYLAETTPLNGMHSKVLIVSTLYGLPMLSVNLTGRDPVVDNSELTAPTPVVGSPYGLQTSDFQVNPITLNKKEVNLALAGTNQTQIATYYSGRDGVVANPLEPIFPLELHNVSASSNVLRGVGFVRGTYTDLPNIFPLTAQPEFDQSHTQSTAGSGYFYPVKPWSVNYFDALNNGATRLSLMPAQFKSDTLGSLTGTLRTYNSMGFKLYYSNSTNIAIKAVAPNISGVSGTYNSVSNSITFSATVTGDVPTQEVWVTYTGLTGNWYGKWDSVQLTPSGTNPSLWTGTLALGTTPFSDVRFMVQAANGTGLVTLSTNFGDLYRVSPPTPVATSLTLQGLPASANFQSAVPALSATLLDANNLPVAGKTVVFSIGSQLIPATTNASGVATPSTSDKIRQNPGVYPTYAYFSGDKNGTPPYLPSSSLAGQVTVSKQPTALSLALGGGVTTLTIQYGSSTTAVATLKDGNGTPLSQKSVLFQISSGAGSYGTTIITDKDGKAVLGAPQWPVGSYTLQAFFGGGVVGQPADDQYLAQTSGTVTLNITKSNSSTSVSGTPSTITSGQSVTLAAVVGAVAPGFGTPTGTVTFKEGAVVLGTAPLVNGQASLPTNAFVTTGLHSVSASYSGDGSFNASDSTTSTVITVASAPTVTYPDPAVTNITPVKATLNTVVNANYSSLTTVVFKWGTDSNNLSNSLNITPVPGSLSTDSTVSAALTGLQSNTTYYFRLEATNGVGTTLGAISSFTTAMPATTTTTISGTPTLVSSGTLVTFKATVSSEASSFGPLTGTVTFKEGATVLGTAPLANGQASLTISFATTGSHTVSASYSSDSSFSPSDTVTPVVITVANAPTVTYPTTAVTGLTAAKATLNGIVNANNSALTSVAFKWGTSSNNLSNTANVTPVPSSLTTDSAVSANLTGLQPNTTYYFRLDATNGISTTQGTVKSFTTPINFSDFNLYIFGDVTLGNKGAGSKVEGKLAVGGNGSFNNWSLATSAPAATDNLLVNGNLTLNSTQIKGNAVYGGTLTRVSCTITNGSFIQRANSVEVVNTPAYIKSISQAWKNQSGTTVTPKPSKPSEMDIYGVAGVNVFNVSGANMANLRDLDINAPAGATVVINISGTSTQMTNIGISLYGGITAQNVVYNFYEATSLTVYKTTIQGTLWAPYATATVTESKIYGSIIAQTLKGDTFALYNNPFKGILPL